MWDSIWKHSKQREQHVIIFFFHLLRSTSKADIPLDHCDKLAAWLLLPDRTNRFAFQMWLTKYSIERIEFLVRDFGLSVRSHLKDMLQLCLFFSLSIFFYLFRFYCINWKWLTLWKRENHERGSDGYSEKKRNMKEPIQPWHFNWNDDRNQ